MNKRNVRISPCILYACSSRPEFQSLVGNYYDYFNTSQEEPLDLRQLWNVFRRLNICYLYLTRITCSILYTPDLLSMQHLYLKLRLTYFKWMLMNYFKNSLLVFIIERLEWFGTSLNIYISFMFFFTFVTYVVIDKCHFKKCALFFTYQ